MTSKNIKLKIKEYFFKNPTKKLRVRQIEREVGVKLPSAIRYTKELEKEGILREEEVVGIKIYSADRSSKQFLFEKKLSNIKRLHDSGLIGYLIENLSNPEIILFGSFFKGEDVETSDIDIYVESVSKKELDLKRFENILERKIQVFKYNNIKKVENKNLANNIINGITLNGFVEVF